MAPTRQQKMNRLLLCFPRWVDNDADSEGSLVVFSWTRKKNCQTLNLSKEPWVGIFKAISLDERKISLYRRPTQNFIPGYNFQQEYQELLMCVSSMKMYLYLELGNISWQLEKRKAPLTSAGYGFCCCNGVSWKDFSSFNSLIKTNSWTMWGFKVK